MDKNHYVYGPVPSRRLGISLGISPIPKKTCNYSCIYCQLGRTDHLTNIRKEFFPLKDILDEFGQVIGLNTEFDVVTIVGEGEPTLYLKLGELINGIKAKTDKPIAVITNGALLNDKEVQDELCCADIVLPSLDAYDNNTYRVINRPSGRLDFNVVLRGLENFSYIFKGQLWLEIMLIKDMNDDNESIKKFRNLLKSIKYDRLYLNTPIRPPAESYVQTISEERLKYASDKLGGISIELLASKGFHSGIADDYKAIISIIMRHPMNQFEIDWFLTSRQCVDIQKVINELNKDSKIEKIRYKGFKTYRLY